MIATAQGYEYARFFPKESAQILIDTKPKDTFPNLKFVFESQDFMSKNYVDKKKQWGSQDIKSWTGYSQFILDSGAILGVTKNLLKMDFTLYYQQILTLMPAPKLIIKNLSKTIY